MNTSSKISQHQKRMALLPAACLALLTLINLSAYGRPEDFPVTLTILVVVATTILVMALVRAKP